MTLAIIRLDGTPVDSILIGSGRKAISLVFATMSVTTMPTGS